MRILQVMLLASLLVEGAKPAATPFYAPHRGSVETLTNVGRRLFEEKKLSANGDQSCATCHDRTLAYGPRHDLPAGKRAVPSLRYLQRVPRFSLHFIEPEDGSDQGPTGGLMWDGRAQSAHDQALLPLLSPDEMGNASRAALAKKVQALPYMKEAFGEQSDDDALNAALHALEVFQQSPREFAPYDSRFDRHALTEREERGRKLFEAKDKGNCASCHPSVSRDGGAPPFTDWGYVDIGRPKTNDKGLCPNADVCGLFRTPSLRNVARRNRFFHDGSVHSLTEVVRFYASKDSTEEAKAHLSEVEIADVVAFLDALSDRDASGPADRRLQTAD